MFCCLHQHRLLLWPCIVTCLSRFAFPRSLGGLACFSCVLGSWAWEALFSAICSLPWLLAIIKGCPDHHIFSQFNFQNCLNSSEPQSLWIQASQGLPVLPSLCIPIPPVLCGSNTFTAETFSILSENVMKFEMVQFQNNIPTGNLAGHKKCFSLFLCLCCSVVCFGVVFL